jgi:Tol biopolymer transport system component
VLQAVWSSDAKTIIFTSEREHKKSEIFRVNLDGSGLDVLVADKHLSLYSPIVSPDSQHLVVEGLEAGQDPRVLMLDLGSHNSTVLARGLHASVLWQHN